jgi:hypothetical protein
MSIIRYSEKHEITAFRKKDLFPTQVSGGRHLLFSVILKELTLVAKGPNTVGVSYRSSETEKAPVS